MNRPFKEQILSSISERHNCNLMCTKCYNIDKRIKWKMNFSLSIMDFDNMSDENIEDFDLSFEIDPWEIKTYCKECSKITNHVFIDSNIATIISALNKEGYMTEFSCEGHGLDDLFYIKFAVQSKRDARNIFKLLNLGDEHSIFYDIFDIGLTYYHKDKDFHFEVPFYYSKGIKPLLNDKEFFEDCKLVGIRISINPANVSADYIANGEYIKDFCKLIIINGFPSSSELLPYIEEEEN